MVASLLVGAMQTFEFATQTGYLPGEYALSLLRALNPRFHMGAQRELAAALAGQAAADTEAAREQTAAALQRLAALEQRLEAFKAVDVESLAEVCTPSCWSIPTHSGP